MVSRGAGPRRESAYYANYAGKPRSRHTWKERVVKEQVADKMADCEAKYMAKSPQREGSCHQLCVVCCSANEFERRAEYARKAARQLVTTIARR